MANSASIRVTGAAGDIGAHTCKALTHAGYRPVAFDNLSVGRREFVRWGPFVEGDIGDVAAVSAACRAHAVSAVIHFAASALVGESVRQPAKYYSNNVVGTLSLLEGMRHTAVNTIVMSRSCAIYGVPAKQPIDEDTG